MGRYYEFSGDDQLTQDAYEMLHDTDQEYFAGMHAGMLAAAAASELVISDATNERWFRLCNWMHYADDLLDSPRDFDRRQAIFNDSIRALAPGEWTPDNSLISSSPQAYTWAAITRSSFSEGDIAPEARSMAHDIACSLGHIALHKMAAPRASTYIQVCRAEGMLLADLFMSCLSDDEAILPQARRMHGLLRMWSRMNIVADSTADFKQDARQGIIDVLPTAGAQWHLLLATISEVAHSFAKAPYATWSFIKEAQ